MASEVQPLCTQTSGPGLAEEEARSLEAMEIPDTSPRSLYPFTVTAGTRAPVCITVTELGAPWKEQPTRPFYYYYYYWGEYTCLSGAGNVFFSHCISDT